MLYRLSISVLKNMGIFWAKNALKKHPSFRRLKSWRIPYNIWVFQAFALLNCVRERLHHNAISQWLPFFFPPWAVFTIFSICTILGMSYEAKLLWWSSHHTVFWLLCSDYHLSYSEITWVFFEWKSALKNTHILFVKKLGNIRDFNP